jgi:inosose dehydratase
MSARIDLGPLTGRVAGAPISWGVCEVPGWGHQMPVERVLREMAELGLVATELGPDGFLPEDPVAASTELLVAGLTCVGGFVPVVLHADAPADGGPADTVTEGVRARLAHFTALSAGTLVLAADTGLAGYDTRPALDEAGWTRLLARLDLAAGVAAEAGITATLHPHVGTMVENADDVSRVLGGCGIGLCLDTGHLLIGGADPVALAQRYPQRIAHVHLKDVDAALAARVRAGELTYTEAVKTGLYQPLGRGDVDVAAIVTSLEAAGYTGWYVLEQDTVLHEDPAPGDGPWHDVATSLEYLASVAAR